MGKRYEQALWRDVAKSPRFFVVDARAALSLLLFLLHIKLWTFFLSLGTILFFLILERFSFTVPIFLRWLKSALAGPIRTARPWWRE